MDSFKGKKIAILGYGLEGRSLVSFLVKQNPEKIDIFDEKVDELDAELDYKNLSITKVKIADLDLNDYNFVFRSPGIKLNLINVPKEKISTLTNLFFSLSKGKIVVVTGTKGKSTTALLISEILRLNQKRVFIGGNIGKSMLDFVSELTDESFSVLELSSFQLQDLKYSPTSVVILPIFPDHLDYHQDFDEYIKAKKKSFSASEKTKIICSRDNSRILDLENIDNQTVLFSAEDASEEEKDFSRNCQIPLVDVVAGSSFAVSESLKVDFGKLQENFKKLPLRIEEIGSIGGVRFYNDSASTNPISTQNAINILDGKILLIMGGSSKGIDVSDLCNKISMDKKIQAIYLFGAERLAVENLLNKFGFDRLIFSYDSLSEVFNNLDISGVDNVLFSPAFASFDQYKNYKERGEHFNQLFNDLKCKNT